MRTGSAVRRRINRYAPATARGQKLGRKTLILRADAEGLGGASLPELRTVGRTQASA